ncbi:branched-chain amino acid ABC transporter permease [Stagnihabitans tardus]|uniref:Branched-chain amino acid ABC transporter permease n=1 Tax=Stagnihabitans tardus TaxID=2699202 RepID=A0AAE4YBR7_9RHOB|nr:branched-chain amino acid ABC transporter permease [Stagnihabitans tardus]NBZ89746.1 branched-chain amino acid ABC transporter permease [Stagnihabitans tardus]
MKTLYLFGGVAFLYVLTGLLLSWNVSLSILVIGLLSSITALGVNMQWGYAGLFSTGIVGSVALGGLAVVFVSGQPVPEAFAAQGDGVFLLSAGWQIIASVVLALLIIAAAVRLWAAMAPGRRRNLAMTGLLVAGFFLYRAIFDPAVSAVEAYDPATHGNIGGLGLPSLLAWPVGALFAAAAAWAIGKICLGLREDYLAIATLGIAEIIITVMKSEDWMSRGVKNFVGLPRPWPLPYEVDLQQSAAFLDFCANWGFSPITASTILVKLIYCAVFALILGVLIWLLERAVHSPWGRMMRAIRDNEVSAAAMGKDVKRQHLIIFILGSAVVGMTGAMYVSMLGQLVPGEFSPLRFTFLIWIMVIVGGSGNNWGSVLGGLLVGWLWLVVDNAGPAFADLITRSMEDGALKTHLKDVAPQMRLLTLGVALLLVLRFAPKGLIPEK